MEKYSYSRVKCFMGCPVEYFHKYVVKDIPYVPSAAQSRGSLLDAVITKGYSAVAGQKVNADVLANALSSTYGDGSEHVGNLLLKSGLFGKEASRVLDAGMRLRSDPVVVKLLKKAVTQRTLKGKVAGHDFEGTPDIITELDDTVWIIDVKKTSQYTIWAEIETSDGPRNRPMQWWDAYDYWMQLAVYKSLLQQNSPEVTNIRCGLLAASEETDDVSRIEFVPLVASVEKMEKIIGPALGRMQDMYSGGWEDAEGCGLCKACRSRSHVAIPAKDIMPVIRYYLGD